MVMTRISAPALEPVTLMEAKSHLRVISTSEDMLIKSLITSAREEVEAATGLALITQNWRLYLDMWPASSVVQIPKHPVQMINQLTIFDDEGTPSSFVPNSAYLDKSSRPARFIKPDNAAYPQKSMNGIEIDIKLGFGDAPSDVPETLKRAILLLVSFWFEYRGTGKSENQEAILPDGFERIISRYQHVRI